jgi:hypothetical protein
VMDISCKHYTKFILQSFFKCYGKNNTNPQICSGNGVCKGLNQCSCEVNYSGNECQFTSCFGILSNQTNVCSGNGNCSEFNICTCSESYGGKECQERYQNETIVFGSGQNNVKFISFILVWSTWR